MEKEKCSLEKEDIVINEANAPRGICVTGFPSKTTSNKLVIHFQKRKHGGGDIECIHITEKRVAVIVFDEPKVVRSVLEKKHRLGTLGVGVPLIVKPLPEMIQVDNIPEIFQLVTAWIHVRAGVMKSYTREEIGRLLDNIKEGTSIMWYEASDGFLLTGTLQQVTESRGLLLSHYLRDSQNLDIGSTTPDNDADDREIAKRSVVVSNISPRITKDDISLHFQKSINGGGEINDVHFIDREKAVIVFEEREVAERVAKHCHVLCGRELEVRWCRVDQEVFSHVTAVVNLDLFQISAQRSHTLLEKVKNRAGLTWRTMDDDGYLSGTFRQIENAHKILEEYFVQRPYLQLTEDANVPRNILKMQLRNEVKLSLYQGDITEEKVDAIINPTKAWVQHGQESVADAIMQKGGRQVMEDHRLEVMAQQKNAPLQVGDAVSTRSGNLTCQFIIHTVGPDWQAFANKTIPMTLLRTACLKSLRLAVRLRLSSVAIPPIGSGSCGMPKDICARNILQAVEEFSTNIDAPRSNLRDVRIVISDEPTIDVFREVWLKRYTSQNANEIYQDSNESFLSVNLAKRMPSTSVLQRETEGLTQARGAFASELEGKLGIDYAQLRQMLDNEVQLRNKKEHELWKKEMDVKELQEKLRKEQQTKRTIEEELSRARSACAKKDERFQVVSQLLKEELGLKNNTIREQRLAMELQRQRKTTLEETLRRLRLQIEEERNRHVSTERELQSALSAVMSAELQSALSELSQRELTELQRRETRDWIIQREEVTMSGKDVGQGAWGTVCEGTFRSCKVAVKKIHELILNDHNRRLFEREMNIASCCRHPNLLQFIGATNDNGSPLFVTELLDTSLRQLLSERALNPEEIINLALDVAKGLNYLHLNKPLPIIHRDISSANVLLWRRDERWRAKLSDYGAANFMRQCMTANPGAMIYSAPEAFTPQQSPKVDVYSFGVLLCEMCIRELPDAQDRPNQIQHVSHDVLRGLIQRCVQRDPEKRPTMGEVIRDLEQLRVISG